MAQKIIKIKITRDGTNVKKRFFMEAWEHDSHLLSHGSLIKSTIMKVVADQGSEITIEPHTGPDADYEMVIK